MRKISELLPGRPRIKDLLDILRARARMLASDPAGRPTWIVCIHCLTTHIDQGIWIYREHKTHLCLKCGELIKVPFKEPTRGVPFGPLYYEGSPYNLEPILKESPP